MTETGVRPSTAKVLAAFAAVYVVWGSTYLAIRVAIDTLPPLLMAGARFLLAGTILYAVMRLRGVPAPTPRQWRATALIGALLLGFGNGGVVLAERTVPSGIAALLVAMVPMWMVLLEWLRPGGSRPTLRVVSGLLIGFAGIVLLVGPAGLVSGEGVDPLGALLLTIGSAAWAAGSIYARGADLPGSALLATGMEMLCGGAVLLIGGIARGELGAADPSAFTTESVLALLYLVVVGSLVGFTAYVWLLGVSTPARVSTYAYVNPVVAVLLGWWLLNEPLTARVLGAAAVIVLAVAVITTGRRADPQPRDEEAPDEGAKSPPARRGEASRSAA
jgi:drug/metabolite transporter (DMT)-like permease